VNVVLTHAAAVGVGGFIGSLARYGLATFVYRFTEAPWIPYGTLVVNLLGCLLIGMFAGLMEGRQMFAPELRLFVLIGVLGGFTTFSTFGYENFMLLRNAEYLRMGANIAAHVIGGLVLVWLGYLMTTKEIL
jgi:fluoride exporter